jgi:hypothetical protein
VLHHVAGLIADEVYDGAERGQFPGQAAPADMVLPEVVRGQHLHVFRRMARAFDDLAGDLAAGRLPLPACMAEEIALDILIEQARDTGSDLIDDDMIKLGGLPSSPHDFAWDHLQDVLFQDKDYEGYLYAADAAGAGELDHWFEEFNNITPRDPGRGFRR